MMKPTSRGRVSASAGEHETVGDAEAAAAWSARYREYLEGSMARTAQAQDLNREVIRRVAAGQLAPWTIESHLSTFAATRAAAYSQQIANLTMAFLTGLIQMGSTYSHELVQAVLPGAVPAPEAVAPDFDPARSASWFSDLTVFAARENERATAMLRTVMDKVAAGELAPTDVEQVSSSFHAAHLPDSTSQLVGLYLDLLNGLEGVHASFAEEYLRTLTGQGADTTAGQESAVQVDAPIGAATSLRFAVTNTDPEPTVVACMLSGIRRADGIGPAFDPVVGTTPERLELAPGAEAAVELTIRPDADHFQPGQSYDGVFRVTSATRTLLELPLRIRALAPESAPEPPAPEAGSPGPERPQPPAPLADTP
jgi:hypothetical protein